MKKILFVTLTLLLCMACSSDDKDNAETISVYEIPASCIPNIDKDKIMIICSEAEFKNIFADNSKLLRPVNFSHAGLLLVRGVSTSGISKIEKELTQTGNGYELTVTVSQNLLAVLEPWCVAYIVPKGIDKNTVKLTVNYQN